MEIAMEKKRLRQWVKERQKELQPQEKKEGDAAICKRILELKEYQEAKVLFCFIGTADEIDTKMILAHAWNDGKKVAVPKCGGKGLMDAYQVNSFSEVAEGAYGILEPKEGCGMVLPEEIDFAVLPCVACDREGFRLGHGGGYYDRYLEGAKFRTAVVCREKLLLDKTPIERFDSQADWVVTEKESIRIPKG